MDVLAVGGGAIIGALARWQITVHAKMIGINPWTTMGINIIGSFILGALTAKSSKIDPNISLLLGTGFCGSFTTLSTFSVDVFNFIRQKMIGYAILLIFLTNSFSLSAAALAYTIFSL